MEFYKNISYMVTQIFLMLFIGLFTVHRFSRWKTVGICAASILLLRVTDIVKLNLFSDSDVVYLTVSVFQIFVVQAAGLFIAEKRNSMVLFIGLTASNYVLAGTIVSSVLYIYTNNFLFSLVGNILAQLVILLFLVSKIRNIWHACQSNGDMQNWWLLCLIPALFYCGFAFLTMLPCKLEENLQSIPGILIFIITMFVSYVIVFRYVESESHRKNVYWKNVLFKSYIKGLENQYYLVEQSEKNMKILRHDMRHYSGMIDLLLEQGEYDEIRKVTKYINDVADENKITKYCDNLLANTVLKNMMEQAEASGIKVQQDIFAPRELPVNEYEFASVIANLYENALHCVKELAPEKRCIEAKVHCSKDHLLIHMQNAYEQDIQFDEYTGLPKSKAGGEHGLGMQSVLAFSDKIGGNIGAYCEAGIFHILLFAKFQDNLRRNGNISDLKKCYTESDATNRV